MVLAGWLWFYTGSFPQMDDGYPGPSLFPRLIAIGLGLAGVVLSLKAVKGRRAKSPDSLARRTLAGTIRLGVGILLVSAYPLLTQSVHFIPVMAGFILIFGLLLRNPAWHALFMAVLSAGLMYLMFTQLLGVPL